MTRHNDRDSGRADRVERTARLQWVPISMMRVSARAQRDLNAARVTELAEHLDLERIGSPVVSYRGGYYWIIDGQHRIAAMKKTGHGGWQVQCWTYHGLTESAEAEMFLALNDTLTVGAYARFKVAVEAGRPAQTDIQRIVHALGLRIGPDRAGGAIAAVHTLERVYGRKGGAQVLARALRIIRDAFGDAGLDAAVIDGISLVCARYDGQLNDPAFTAALARVAGGIHGLLGHAEVQHKQTRSSKASCVAAAAVDLANRRMRGRKLLSWWKAVLTDAAK
jgi:hypothetical protein